MLPVAHEHHTHSEQGIDQVEPLKPETKQAAAENYKLDAGTVSSTRSVLPAAPVTRG
jgi:hypothetical protein